MVSKNFQPERFKHLLLTKRSELLNSLSGLDLNMARSARYTAARILSHPTEADAEDYDPDTLAELLDSENEILRDVVHALQRLQDGGYGRCECCGKRISLSRLEAIPYARYCLSCAEETEKNWTPPKLSAWRVRPIHYCGSFQN
ncbi:TraR/DksA family transcriptional regulator [Planctomycetota bacterium]